MTLFHITQRSAWDSATVTGFYTPKDFAKDGFIHCSTVDQVINVANRIYKNYCDLVLLWISDEKISAPLVYENLENGEELFPHLYGELPIEAVSRVSRLIKNCNGQYTFADNLELT